MAKKPFMMFFTTDWRASAKLRVVSFAARGLWIDMLTIMHEAQTYGELTVAGRKICATDLARLLGGDASEVETLLGELFEAGVFSVRKNGVIYCRRMERDENLRRKKRENGKKGGNPSLCKQKENEASDNHHDKPIFHIPYSIDHIPEKKENDVSNETSFVGSGDLGGGLFPDGGATKPRAKAKQAKDYTPAFDEFWRNYPRTRNMSKWDAFRKFDVLSDEDQQLAIRGAPAYAEEVKRRGLTADKIKHADGWLSGRRFETATDPELQAQSGQRGLVVAGFGGEKATLRDKLNALDQWAKEKENGRR